MQDADVVRLMSRLSTVTRTPAANAEVLQLLRYDEGQRYDVHNDYTGGGHDGASGGRLFSFVLFLSSPEEGGELHFADVNLTIRAERGAAVLWPSLSAQDFDLPELLSHHASVPVRRGQKLAAVTWLHLYDWRTLQLDRGCAESLGAIIPPFALLPRYLTAREAAGLERIVLSSMIAQAQRAQRQAQARREARSVLKIRASVHGGAPLSQRLFCVIAPFYEYCNIGRACLHPSVVRGSHPSCLCTLCNNYRVSE